MFIGEICGYTNRMVADSINGSRYIGGYNKGTISNCYNTGDAWGIVGRNYGKDKHWNRWNHKWSNTLMMETIYNRTC